MAELAITIPTDKMDEAKAVLDAWRGHNGYRVIGEEAGETGLYIDLLTGGIFPSAMRGELEKRLRPIGGRVGAKGEWLIAAEEARRSRS